MGVAADVGGLFVGSVVGVTEGLWLLFKNGPYPIFPPSSTLSDFPEPEMTKAGFDDGSATEYYSVGGGSKQSLSVSDMEVPKGGEGSDWEVAWESSWYGLSAPKNPSNTNKGWMHKSQSMPVTALPQSKADEELEAIHGIESLYEHGSWIRSPSSKDR